MVSNDVFSENAELAIATILFYPIYSGTTIFVNVVSVMAVIDAVPVSTSAKFVNLNDITLKSFTFY